MTCLTPWAIGVRELVARPVARGRVHAPSRLTARAHGAWFWLALWAATAAAGFVALIPVFDGDPPVPARVVLHILSGVSFAACGLIAWRRRPDSLVGRLLTVAGFGVLMSPILDQVDWPLAFTVALLFGELWIVLFVTLILSFVTGGRLTSAVDLVLVGAFVFGLLILQLALMLFLPDDSNLL